MQDLINEGVVGFYLDLRSGVYWDRSGNGNDGAPTDITLDYRGATYTTGSSEIIIASDPSMHPPTSFCWGVKLADFGDFSTNFQLFGQDTLFLNWNGTRILLNQSGTDPQLVVDMSGVSLLTINMTDTVAPRAYGDGALLGDFDNVKNVSPATDFLQIGSGSLPSIVEAVFMVTRELTASEQQSLSDSLEDPYFGEAAQFQEGDVFLDHTLDGGEIRVTDGTTQMIGGLESAVYLRLFGGNRDDRGQADTSKTWWANRLENTPVEEQYRSRTQNALQALPTTSASLKFIEGETLADLQMFKDIGAATDIAVNAFIPSPNRIGLAIDIVNGENRTSLVWEENWKAML
jgi:phage gp46-like protein